MNRQKQCNIAYLRIPNNQSPITNKRIIFSNQPNAHMSLKKTFTTYFLQQKLKAQLKLKKRTTKSAMDLGSAKSVSILFDATNPENRAHALDFAQYLQKKGKKIYVLAFLNDKDKHERSFPFDYFNLTNLNWAGVPKCQKLDDFLEKKSDILLTITPRVNHSLDFVAALAQSHLKIGTFTDSFFGYDVMFSVQSGMAAYLQQINYFLTKQSVLQYERESALV
jgi:hypothetical protein